MTCHIYIVGAVQNHEFCAPSKIGISTRPHARLEALQNANPNELSLFRIFNVPDRSIAGQIEECFLSTQKEHRLRGEWFDFHPQEASEILAFQIRLAIDAFTDLTGEARERAFEMAGVA